MTQGLRNMLGLPLTDIEDALKERGLLPDPKPYLVDEPEGVEELDPALVRTVALAQAAEKRLGMLEGKDHADAMDVLHAETLKHAKDLMDFGFNIDPRGARGMFEVAANMFGRAIEAKNSKRDAQLKAMKLALDARKLDLDEQKMRFAMGENTVDTKANVVVEDRNELIRKAREQAKGES